MTISRLIIVLTSTKGGVNMSDFLEAVIPKEEQEEIKELVATLMLLPKEDRAILLSNANAFRVRRDIEKAKE